MSASQRRRGFKQQLVDCDNVDDVRGHSKRNVVSVRTGSGMVLVWMHYSKKFNFWGGAVKKNRTLGAQAPKLLHAFLGQHEDQYYVVPDTDLEDPPFYLPEQEKNGNYHWRLARNDGKPPNGDILESDYTNLCKHFA